MNNGTGTLPFNMDLNDFNFSMSYHRKHHSPEAKNYDMLIGYRTAGRKRKHFGCDINISAFIHRLAATDGATSETTFTKMAVGVSRLKKTSSILAVFDHPEIPDFGKINHQVTQNTHSFVINNKGLVIKVLDALQIERPDKPDCDVRLFAKFIHVHDKVYKIEPLHVEYTDANDTVTRKEFKDGVLKAGYDVKPSNKRF